METAEPQPDKKDQETQTIALATLYIEPGSTHNKLLGGNRQQLVDFIKTPSETGRTIVSDVLLQIGRPPMQEVKSYIDLLTRTHEDPPTTEHFQFDPQTWEFYRADLDDTATYTDIY